MNEINGRLKESNDLENKLMEIKLKHTGKKRQNRQTTTKIKKNHNDLWDDIKWSNIHVSGTPKHRGKRLGQEKTIKEIIAIIFSNFIKWYQPTDPRKLTNVKQDKQIKPHLGSF